MGASGISYFSEGGAVPLASAESLGASTKPVLSSPGAIIGDKWVLVNRARPLSKAAEVSNKGQGGKRSKGNKLGRKGRKNPTHA